MAAVAPSTHDESSMYGYGGAIDRVVDYAYWQVMILAGSAQVGSEAVCELIDRLRLRWSDVREPMDRPPVPSGPRCVP